MIKRHLTDVVNEISICTLYFKACELNWCDFSILSLTNDPISQQVHGQKEMQRIWSVVTMCAFNILLSPGRECLTLMVSSSLLFSHDVKMHRP